jgi:phosphatidylserine decarboxylase
MAATTPSASLPPAEAPQGVQPGGVGFFGLCELAWAHIRRTLLRRFRPQQVEHWHSLRQGECTDCPHDIIDPRDLKYVRNVCGYWFRPEDDVFAYRARLGFAQYGFAELIGYGFICFVLLLVSTWLGVAVHWAFELASCVVLLRWLEVVWFFRDPPRSTPGDPRALVSPADGTVSHIETVDAPDFPGGRALRVSIFLSVFNVHVNRVPRSGRVTDVRYFPGAFLDARNSECAVRNEQLWVDLVDAATGLPLRVKQISGAIARRIVCAVKPGDEIKVGERFGMIKFGSRTDVLVPAQMVHEVFVRVGDKVKGAETTLLSVHEKFR